MKILKIIIMAMLILLIIPISKSSVSVGNNEIMSHTVKMENSLQLNNGFKINSSGTKPTCDATTRGTLWFNYNSLGIADTLQVCVKTVLDAYAWVGATLT